MAAHGVSPRMSAQVLAQDVVSTELQAVYTLSVSQTEVEIKVLIVRSPYDNVMVIYCNDLD